MLKGLDEWADIDPGKAAEKAILFSKLAGVNILNYDCIGVGAGVKAETNRIIRDGEHYAKNMFFVGWNASFSPIDADKKIIKGDSDSPTNGDLFSNLKAQAGWRLRSRFEKTWRMVNYGTVYPVDELICIPSKLNKFTALIDQLSQPTYDVNSNGKIVIDKKPPGTRSPNLYDAVVIAFNPYKFKIKRAGAW
jgi:phage terminase large subunit